jgi:predicted GIY-YIG superfamily endonuclease
MCYIYTITSLEKYDGERLIYVGSTTDWEKRFKVHKSDCFNENSIVYNSKVYRLIRQHGWDAFVMEVIEVMDDNATDKELLLREQHYIDKYNSKSSMNTKDAIIELDVVEYHRVYDAERYKNNREKSLAQNTEWRKNNRDRYNESNRNSYHKRMLWKNVVKELGQIDI